MLRQLPLSWQVACAELHVIVLPFANSQDMEWSVHALAHRHQKQSHDKTTQEEQPQIEGLGKHPHVSAHLMHRLPAVICGCCLRCANVHLAIFGVVCDFLWKRCTCGCDVVWCTEFLQEPNNCQRREWRVFYEEPQCRCIHHLGGHRCCSFMKGPLN